MAKRIDWKGGLGSVLLWSVISAAFIGPGTVTTAASAGALHGLKLIWALLFSTLATILVQEGVVRLTLVSGKSFGDLIRHRFGSEKNGLIPYGVFIGLWLGCAAYEAGNLVGAAAGIRMIWAVPQWIAILLIGLAVYLLLKKGNTIFLARFLGGIVALMGLAFCWMAWHTPQPIWEWLSGSLVPSLPTGSSLLVIGLIGTTIVPYNLFLASGVARPQAMGEMRLGIAIAVGIGGLISLAILVVGTRLEGSFSFLTMAKALDQYMGIAGKGLFALGLFAAGFSSAITAPMAASLAGSRLSGEKISAPAIWLSVLGLGLVFGLADIRPIPLIISAQAFNGLLLPLMTALLYVLLNDASLMGHAWINRPGHNALFLMVVGVTCWLGVFNILQAGLKALGKPTEFSLIQALLVSALMVGFVGGVYRMGAKQRRG